MTRWPRWTSKREHAKLMKTSRRCSMLSFWVWAKQRTLGRSLARTRARTRVRCKPNSTSISNRNKMALANTRLSRCKEQDNPININILRNTIKTLLRIHSWLSSSKYIRKSNTITCSTRFNSQRWKIPWKAKIRRWKRCWKHKRSQRVKIFILAWEIEIALARQGESNRDLDRRIRCLKRIF
jgi:hypothetical protein